MTGNTPMSGPDTKAAFNGLIIGTIAVAIVVLSIVYLTNQKFAGHAPETTTEQPH